MLEKTMQEFSENAESYTKGAILNDDFVKIKTSVGNAVLISEEEWNILTDAMKMLIQGSQKKKSPPRCCEHRDGERGADA